EDVLVVVPPREIGAVRARPGRIAVQVREECERQREQVAPCTRVEEDEARRRPARVLRAQRQPFEKGHELRRRQRRAERDRERGQDDGETPSGYDLPPAEPVIDAEAEE